jgi:hypothetical protein
MQKRFALFLLAPLFLLACSGTSSTTSACSQQYWDGEIGVCLPQGWNVVDRETLNQRGLADDVIIAFQAQDAIAGQFPTVTVTVEAVPASTDSAAYSQASIRAVSALPGYKLIDTRTAKVDGDSVSLHIFTAQPLSEEPERRFYQVSAVHSGKGYTFTGLTPLSVSSSLEKQVTSMLQSATFKDQMEAASSSK